MTEAVPATSWSRPVHVGASSQVEDAVVHSDQPSSPICTTRLTIFRSPSSSGSGGKSSSGGNSPRVSSSLSSFTSSSRSLAFPLNPALGGSFGPDPLTPVERATPSVTHPRVPTKVLLPHEVNAELQTLSGGDVSSPRVDGGDYPNQYLATPAGASVTGIPGPADLDSDISMPSAELEPLQLTPLADDHHLPFADRPEEVWDLLTHSCNTTLKGRLERLSCGTLWPDLEKKLRECRRTRPDAVWVQDLERLVKEQGRDVAAWTQLRGVLGADDIGYTPSQQPHALHMESFEEGEAVLLTTPVLSSPDAKTPSLPSSSQSNALGLVGALGLARRNSLDSVFLSDSGDEASGPQSPGLGGSFGNKAPTHPAQLSPMSPLGKPEGQHASLASSPTRARHHPRSRSHGGAVAAGGAIMESIHEDEVLDSPDRLGPGLSRAHSSGSMTYRHGGEMVAGRMMGLRISALTPLVTASTTLPEPGDGEAGGAGAGAEGGGGDSEGSAATATTEGRPAKAKLRYSFGAVDAERLGLGLGRTG